MKKNKYIFFVLVIIIIVLTCIFYYLNINFNDINNSKDDNIHIKYNESDYKISLNELEKLESVNFNTTIRSTSIKNKKVKYTGVELSLLLQYLKINIKSIDKVVVMSNDSYRITLINKEITEKNNVFLVYKINNQYIKNINTGVIGAFQMIIRHDYFSQRWVKGVSKIIIQ